MSKVVRCRDVGMDCDFEARGESEREVLQKAAEHAKQTHGIDPIPPQIVDVVRSKIRDE
jgi:predicted small metal-binding protein